MKKNTVNINSETEKNDTVAGCPEQTNEDVKEIKDGDKNTNDITATVTVEKSDKSGTNDGEKSTEGGFDGCTVSELYGLAELFPAENVAEDVLSDSFRIFAKGRKGAPDKIYSEYLELRNSFEKGIHDKNPARGITGQEKVRAYSGYDGAGIHRNATAGLTKRQMQIARESGMSFREYAELLESVPHGRNL